MPELPEVQTIVSQLKDILVERKIVGVEVRLAKMFEGDKGKIIGKKIKDVRRRAKMIIIDLEGPMSLVTHLKMTGQLVYTDGSDPVTFPNPIPFAGTSLPGKTTHVIFRLDKGTLFFNDMRQFGWVRVVTDQQLATIDKQHGPEPFGSNFTPDYLLKICGNWGRPVKQLLMEQSKISGMGNIYANEALWCAQISPMKRARDLAQKQPEKIKGLYKCIKDILEKGLQYGGSSAADEAFVNARGQRGHMQEHFTVYQKDTTECPRCHHIIRRSTLGGRGTFFCPKCQT